jgi:alpha-L-fucosidase
MKRREFILSGSALTAGTLLKTNTPLSQYPPQKYPQEIPPNYSHRLPLTDVHYQETCGYVEDIPVPEYTWAPDTAYEDFKDIKFGIRLHWGIYSILRLQGESWQFLKMSLQERQVYQELYQSWYPAGFDAGEWVDFFADSGARMFAFTTKHHDGFSMFDTKTKIKKRANWLGASGPVIEDCDLSYSIMETPFKRDVVKELCDAAHKKNMKIDCYFSHPDWYDSDFRPYNSHPFQTPDAATIAVQGKDKRPELDNPYTEFGKSGVVIKPNPSTEEVARMMARHRTQLTELLTRYGKIDMVCLDQWLGPEVWPTLRETLLQCRKLSPDTMFRARGIGNYGDYYTPEGFVPGSKENSDTPWFVIYPLGNSFSYDPSTENYKGTEWIIRNLVDSVAKGGNFMVGIGPDGAGRFHPEAIRQLKAAGDWLKKNGEGIYATRPRPAESWKEGDNIRFTRSKDNKTIYAFVYDWPGEQLILKTVRPSKNDKVRFLGFDQPLSWRYDSAAGLIITIPSEWRSKFAATTAAYGLKIEMADPQRYP